jgi:exodeoxyribonuclease V alpha subunit
MQILVARNDTGQLCRKKVNSTAQNAFNPNGDRPDSKCMFRIGDKAACLRNGYRDEHYEGKRDEWNPKHYVANGELGIVTHLDDGYVSVQFEGRGGESIRFNRNTWGSEIDLGYALSVHKAQGSGFPVTLVLADGESGARFVCSRAWWYTAISRASKLCVTIGRKHVIDQDCRKVDIDNRKTLLGEMIRSWKE